VADYAPRILQLKRLGKIGLSPRGYSLHTYIRRQLWLPGWFNAVVTWPTLMRW